MSNTTDMRPKRAIFRFFELWFQNFWTFVPLNFFYTLISIPILTSGLAMAGMTNVTRNITRARHSFGASDFFDTIKSNWKQSLLIGVINTLVTILLLFGIFVYFNAEGIIADIALCFLLLCFVIFSFMRYYIWLLVITFPLSTKKIYKNSFLFALINFKNNLFLSIVELILYDGLLLIAITLPHFILVFLAMIVAVFILPSFIHLLIQFNVFQVVQKYMIDPYYEEHPDEDVDLRQNLSLKTNVEPKKEDAIFHDT